MKEKFIVKGCNKLKGEIQVRGAKNAIGKMLIASLLTDDEVVLSNVPINQETDIAVELISLIGADVERIDHSLKIKPFIKSTTVPELSRKNRLPVLTLGPLLARFGEARIPFSGAITQPQTISELNTATASAGGDKIGARPVDFHIAALEKMGAEIRYEDNALIAKAKKLFGASIALPYPSVGTTENIILAAVLAEGKTSIQNAAIEPEIVDIVKMLQKMGAIIEFGANRQIFIEGVKKLNGVNHELLPDRLEAASFAIMALATDGDVTVLGANQEHMITFLNTVRRVGGEYQVRNDGIRFFRNGDLKSTHIETDTHPGFATDWQQPLVVLLTQAKGLSVIHETVYEDRFGYTADLCRMGAEIQVVNKCLGDLSCRYQGKMYPHSAVIHGPTKLHGENLVMRDIRAGMAHIIAALIASGESVIEGVDHIDRGYENIDERIRHLGADIKRIKE